MIFRIKSFITETLAKSRADIEKFDGLFGIKNELYKSPLSLSGDNAPMIDGVLRKMEPEKQSALEQIREARKAPAPQKKAKQQDRSEPER